MWLTCVLIKLSKSNKTYNGSILYWKVNEYKLDIKSVRSAENLLTLGHKDKKSK